MENNIIYYQTMSNSKCTPYYFSTLDKPQWKWPKNGFYTQFINCEMLVSPQNNRKIIDVISDLYSFIRPTSSGTHSCFRFDVNFQSLAELDSLIILLFRCWENGMTTWWTHFGQYVDVWIDFKCSFRMPSFQMFIKHLIKLSADMRSDFNRFAAYQNL